MENALQGQDLGDIDVSSAASQSDTVAHLAIALLDSIPEDKERLWPYKVMGYIAQETMRRATAGNEARRISTKDIYTDLQGNKNQEPSAWLSPIWKEIGQKHFPAIEHSLIEHCREAAMNAYPVFVKSDSSPAFYAMEAKRLPPTAQTDDGKRSLSDLPSSAVRYHQDLTLKLSRGGRLLFSGGLSLSFWKTFGMVAWQLALLFVTLTVAGLAWVVVLSNRGPLTGQDLILFSCSIAVPWMGLKFIRATMQLFEDGIAIAPDWMVQIREWGATVEVSKREGPAKQRTIHVRRYTAKCLVCGEMVKLANGNADFPGRIVGRCDASPREHVYSFDSVTQVGEVLRRPPVTIRTRAAHR